MVAPKPFDTPLKKGFVTLAFLSTVIGAMTWFGRDEPFAVTKKPVTEEAAFSSADNPRRSISEQLQKEITAPITRQAGPRFPRQVASAPSYEAANHPGAMPLHRASAPPADALAHPGIYRRAARIEEEANRKLERWASKYGLTETQQDAVFPILARASAAYDPAAFDVEGETLAPVDIDRSVEEQIHSNLTPEQQTQLEDEIIDRDLWWSEIASLLNDEMIAAQNGTLVEDPELPANEASATESIPNELPGAEPGTEPAAPPASHGGSNIFSILNGNP